jgi:hypothetical protein
MFLCFCHILRASKYSPSDTPKIARDSMSVFMKQMLHGVGQTTVTLMLKASVRATSDKRQATSDKRQATSDKRQATSDKRIM